MKHITQYYKRLRATRIQVIFAVLAIYALFLPYYNRLESSGNNYFSVTVNGVYVGKVDEEAKVDQYIREARRLIAMTSEELVFMDTDVDVEGAEVYFGVIDDEKDVKAQIYNALKETTQETMHRSYTVKVNETTVNLASSDEVQQLLDAAIRQYDPDGKYVAGLSLDSSRELTVLTPYIELAEDETQQDDTEGNTESELQTQAGIEQYLTQITSDLSAEKEMDFSDYELGLSGIGFQESVEVVEAYLPEEELTDVDQAINLITKEQEVQQVYTIQSGDTLSEISMKFDLPMEQLIAMNPDKLQSENSIIHVDDELIITVPEPALSVTWEEQQYYEESYDADIIYVDNDNWYTTQQVTLQEPVQGYHKVVASISYRNEVEQSREILKEEIVVEAVPKIVERGTKIPPTYIKPIAGGHITSGFGRRNAPTRGASTNHKGIDWSVPIGTTVVASSSGTVAKAGWASGYGYVVYINHADGRQTRYGHLSKVLVSVGQYVTQGQVIARSGNSGRSTGPHLHFEMLIGGSAVNPLNYLQ